MKHLRQRFEDELEASIDSDGTVLISGLRYTPMQILQAVDRTAFDDAFQEWMANSWLPERLEYLTALLQIGNNADRFDDLLAAVEKQFVVPFIGSGMSAPSGMKTWTAFLWFLRENSNLLEDELAQLLNAGDYEHAASRLKETMPRQLFDDLFTQQFRARRVSEIQGPVRWLPFLFDGSAITTNFDNVLELWFQDCKKPFDQVFTGVEIGDYRRNRNNGERFLLKIHGSFRAPTGRVLTASEYRRFYAQRSNPRKQLAELFKSDSLLFLGCGLSTDRTMDVMKSIADADNNITKHYAILSCPKDDATRRQREHFLTERNIFPLWYDGDHDNCIEAYLVGLLNKCGRV